MHGSSFRGDGGRAIVALAGLLDRYLSKHASEASA